MFKALKKKIINKFVKPIDFTEALKLVKKKYNIGELVFKEPGIRVYKCTKGDNLIRVKTGNSSISIDPLFETSMSHADYMKRVGENIGCTKWNHHAHGRICREKVVLPVSPERYAKKTAPGGLSPEYKIMGNTYFIPSLRVN